MCSSIKDCVKQHVEITKTVIIIIIIIIIM
jgi:hypothetical protein